MKFYAVKKGHVTGIFDNWDECNKAVKGFSGHDFKAFSSKEEAEAYLIDCDIYYEQVKSDVTNGFVVAYCDGSYNEDQKRYSYGTLIIDNKFTEHELCGYNNNPLYIESRNIIGEVISVIQALDWSISNQYKKIKIYYDYEGLEKWATGEWEAKSETAKMYVGVLKNKYPPELIQIVFEKVKGHSNNKYNDKVDELARKALVDRKKLSIQGDNWFIVQYFEEEKLCNIIKKINEEYPQLKVQHDKNSSATRFKLNLGRDKLTITLFNASNKKMLVQGSVTTLFQIMASYIFEIVGIDKIEPIFKNAYRVNIDSKEISNNFEALCGHLPLGYPENIKILLKSSIILLTAYIENVDYGCYAFPALRALEGHMKYMLSKQGIYSSSFKMFEINKAKTDYVYNNNTKYYISDAKIVLKLEEMYNYYVKHRHTLGHFGYMIGSTDSTRMICSKNDADEIIKQCLQFITESSI
ncbi:MAG: viroplasmin family protein [Endomicrobiaceae bacterium]|nr:viroplasmin family protein [Endomicrobiaceae bacterium]